MHTTQNERIILEFRASRRAGLDVAEVQLPVRARGGSPRSQGGGAPPGSDAWEILKSETKTHPKKTHAAHPPQKNK